jgi:hypothetical protein
MRLVSGVPPIRLWTWGRHGSRKGGEQMKKYSKPKAKKVSFGAVLASVV